MSDKSASGEAPGSKVTLVSTGEPLYPQPASDPMTMIAGMLNNPDVLDKIDDPAAFLERIDALDEKRQAREAKRQFDDAMATVQSQLEPVRKRARNTHTKSMYALAEDIERMAMPILTREGLQQVGQRRHQRQAGHAPDRAHAAAQRPHRTALV